MKILYFSWSVLILAALLDWMSHHPISFGIAGVLFIILALATGFNKRPKW